MHQGAPSVSNEPKITWSRRIEIAALAAVSLIVLSGLGLGVTHRYFDVDEIQHTHVTWRISVGDRPFHDFVETHPPFVWYLAAPLMRLMSSPAQAVTVFRWIAALAGLTFVGALLASVRAGRPHLPTRWLVAGFLLVLSHAANLDYLVEIRPDSVAYTLFFLACFLFLREWPERPFTRYAVFAFLVAMAVLSNPKLALLAVIFSLLDLALHIRSRGAVATAIGGQLLGLVVALALALIALYAAGIDPLLAYKLSIGFHQRFLDETTFSTGLARMVLKQPVQLAAIAAGVVAWSGLVLSRRLSPTRLEIALLIFLVVTLSTIPLPYKQYFAPWFLMAAPFIAFLGVGLERSAGRFAGIALVTVLAVAAVGGWRSASAYGASDQVSYYHRMWEMMGRAVGAEGRVVAAPRWHPIVRRDVFYSWFVTFDPGGRDQAAIMREWNPDGYGERFSRSGYVEDLARHPPALIVMAKDGFGLRGLQEAVVAEYVNLHREAYARVSIPGMPDLLVRRDQANWEQIEEFGQIRD